MDVIFENRFANIAHPACGFQISSTLKLRTHFSFEVEYRCSSRIEPVSHKAIFNQALGGQTMQKNLVRSLITLMFVLGLALAVIAAQAPQGGGQRGPGGAPGGAPGGGGAGAGAQRGPGGGGPGAGGPGGGGGQRRGGGGPALTLTSTAWPDGGETPAKYTQATPNAVSPAFSWTNV